jgi:hypothetical protein
MLISAGFEFDSYLFQFLLVLGFIYLLILICGSCIFDRLFDSTFVHFDLMEFFAFFKNLFYFKVFFN